MRCLKCDKELIGRQKKYCSKKCKQRVLITDKRNAYKKETGLSLQSLKGLKRKLHLIKDHGGGCQICGYNKNVSALEFHHKEPSTKLFVIDMRSLSNRGEKSLKKELEKCILVCSNCHQEIHHPHLDMDKINIAE